MSTIVQNILTQTKSIASTTLGATYQEIPFVYELERNDIRRAALGYGVRPLNADTTEGLVKAYTLDHNFEFIFTDAWARAGNSDSQIESAFNTMFNQCDEIFKALLNSKINLPSTVLNVQDPSISEPELLNDNKLAVLRMQYVVKYRSNL